MIESRPTLVLVVEDERDLRLNLEDILQFNGFEAIAAENGLEGYKRAVEFEPDIIISDVRMPEMDGLELLKKLQDNPITRTIPFVFLTAKVESEDIRTGMALGADDYITKPFSVRELMARIKAVLRRSASEAEESTVYSFSDIVIDYDKHQVKKNNQKVELTLKEYELLDILVKNRGKVMKRDVLLDKIWGYEYVGETRTVDVHIRHLRQKLEDDDKNPIYIETVRGIGYRFNDLES